MDIQAKLQTLSDDELMMCLQNKGGIDAEVDLGTHGQIIADLLMAILDKISLEDLQSEARRRGLNSEVK